MKKRFRKIGIAARLTAVVAVILAVFLVPWVWQVAKLAQDKAREEANASMRASTGLLMSDLKILKGDAARYPRKAQRNMIYCVPTCVEMV